TRTRIALALFVVAAAFAFVDALLPPHEAVSLLPWDKAEHFLAFYVIALLARLAFPRAPFLAIAAALSAFGALIEIVQALPIIDRDASVWDWAADSAGIAAALLPVLLAARWTKASGNGRR